MMIVMVIVFSATITGRGGQDVQAKLAVGYKIVFLGSGGMIQFDEHILQMGWRKKTPTRSQ